MCKQFWTENLNLRCPLYELSIDGRILQPAFDERRMIVCNDSECQMADFSAHGNDSSVYIIGGAFLDQLSNCQLLRKDSAPWS